LYLLDKKTLNLLCPEEDEEEEEQKRHDKLGLGGRHI